MAHAFKKWGVEILLLLIKYNVNLNEKMSKKPLIQRAFDLQSSRLICSLIACGASTDITFRTEDGRSRESWSCLGLAIEKEYCDVIDELLKRNFDLENAYVSGKDRKDAIALAVQKGKFKVMHSIL